TCCTCSTSTRSTSCTPSTSSTGAGPGAPTCSTGAGARAPTGAWRRVLLLQALVIPVDVAIAAVGIGDRRDRDDHVAPNLGDERRRLGDEPVRQLHQHLGRAGLTAVQAAHEVVVRLGGGDELPDLLRRQSARVGDLRQVVAVLLQVLDVVVG